MKEMILAGLGTIGVILLLLFLLIDTSGSTKDEADARRVVMEPDVMSYAEALGRREAIDSTSDIQKAARHATDERDKNEARMIEERYAALEEQERLPLRGRLIVVDAGHQKTADLNEEYMAPGSLVSKARVAAGTMSSDGVSEYEYTMLAAEQLKSALEEQGAVVVLSRKEHDVNISNKERAMLANQLEAELYVSLHADGSDDSSVSGYSVLVPSATNNPIAKVVEESQLIGQYINVELFTSTGRKSRGVFQRDNLTGLNWAEVPAVYVELGFMTNAEEFELMQTAEYQAKLVEGITSGIVKYFERNTGL